MFGKPDNRSNSVRKSLSTIASADSPDLQQYQKQQQQSSPPKRSNTTGTLRKSNSPNFKNMATFQRSDTTATSSSRPTLTRVPTTQTRYMEMLLHLDQIPRLHNILSSAFTWILLAGFLVVPGTFTSFKNSQAFKEADSDESNAVAHAIVRSIANIGLLWVSGAFCIIGGLGCIWLWFCWRQNYVWLLNRIFLPACLNSAAGLLTTVVNVYTAQKGVWSSSAIIAASVTGGCFGITGILFLLYNFWALDKVRDLHEREFDPEAFDRRRNKKNRESMVEKVKRKAHEKPLEPGSVV